MNNTTTNDNVQNTSMNSTTQNNNIQETVDNNDNNNLFENNQINNTEIRASDEQVQTENVIKNYVSNNGNQNTKKTLTFNVGPELKIALLIIIVLLVFIFMLPIINDFIRNTF